MTSIESTQLHYHAQHRNSINYRYTNKYPINKLKIKTCFLKTPHLSPAALNSMLFLLRANGLAT